MRVLLSTSISTDDIISYTIYEYKDLYISSKNGDYYVTNIRKYVESDSGNIRGLCLVKNEEILEILINLGGSKEADEMFYAIIID